MTSNSPQSLIGKLRRAESVLNAAQTDVMCMARWSEFQEAAEELREAASLYHQEVEALVADFDLIWVDKNGGVNRADARRLIRTRLGGDGK